MTSILQYLRSVIYVAQIYVAMLLIGILFAPYAMLSKNGARQGCKTYARWAIWSARWMVGIRTEIRGPIPEGEVIIAAKHQSFLDIMMIFLALPQAKFIMKRELMWTPIIGVYAKRLGCIPVDRGRRGAAIAKMVQDVAREFSEPGQLVIYPQGTRVAPGVEKPYKSGISVLYENLQQPCVPVATNVGLLWPRKGIMRKPGLGVVEFLDPIPPGQPRGGFMADLETRIETRSNALMQELGFEANGIHHVD
ncbi:1-acyl-sn-glycerol-3-phosphate acyltransferase [Phaeobacter sp. B1627]|uniref:lysophospholipid acyltransferase family protein n=1 Tax=Phaeobacter sp. B1627 TaxID=2583809 RepID=UPI00111A5116|nr:lysophospholipid acyltransferase family protein [Phaeobacter sp. B1627]TNJ47658.1 1-acyl-sn-glycerol-3-phosphate acyltransferase [Phaeobacter sp. B1627]